MPENKSQHYVPVHHQARWKRPDLPTGREVFAFPKPKAEGTAVRYFSADPRGIFCRDHLYSLPECGGPPCPIMERTFFGDFDGTSAAIISKVIETGAVSPAERAILSRYVVLSHLRSPWEIEKLRPLVGEVIAGKRFDLEDIEFINAECKQRFLEGNSEYQKRNAVFIAIGLEAEKSGLLATYDMSIWTLRSDEGTFVTGDCMQVALKDDGVRRGRLIPLSPRACLVMVSSKQGYRLNRTAKTVRWLNRRIWERSRERIIGFPDAPFLDELDAVRGDARRP